MATMYPQWLPAAVKSNAERKLFDLLRDYLPAEYTVLERRLDDTSSYLAGWGNARK